MKTKRQIRPLASWAAVHTEVARGAPWMIPNSVRRTATEVRQWIGEQFATMGETYLDGWKRAKAQGVRVIPVVVSTEVRL